MNCQKGDMAIVVRSECGNEGKIVTCLKLEPEVHWFTGGVCTGVEPGWFVDIELIGSDGVWDNLIADSALSPIRDQPGEDETLIWAPVPHKETV